MTWKEQFSSISIRTLFENEMSERTCEANAAGENSSFIFTVCIKSVPHYHFKPADVVPQMAVSKPTSKNGEIDRFNRSYL